LAQLKHCIGRRKPYRGSVDAGQISYYHYQLHTEVTIRVTSMNQRQAMTTDHPRDYIRSGWEYVPTHEAKGDAYYRGTILAPHGYERLLRCGHRHPDRWSADACGKAALTKVQETLLALEERQG